MSGQWAIPLLLLPSVPMLWHGIAVVRQSLTVYPDCIVFQRKVRHEYPFDEIKDHQWGIEGVPGLVLTLRGRRRKAKIPLQLYVASRYWRDSQIAMLQPALRELRDIVDASGGPTSRVQRQLDSQDGWNVETVSWAGGQQTFRRNRLGWLPVLSSAVLAGVLAALGPILLVLGTDLGFLLLMLAAIMALVALALMPFSGLVQLRMDSGGVHYGPWGKGTVLPWPEIERVLHFGPSETLIRITLVARNGKQLDILPHTFRDGAQLSTRLWQVLGRPTKLTS